MKTFGFLVLPFLVFVLVFVIFPGRYVFPINNLFPPIKKKVYWDACTFPLESIRFFCPFFFFFFNFFLSCTFLTKEKLRNDMSNSPLTVLITRNWLKECFSFKRSGESQGLASCHPVKRRNLKKKKKKINRPKLISNKYLLSFVFFFFSLAQGLKYLSLIEYLIPCNMLACLLLIHVRQL